MGPTGDFLTFHLLPLSSIPLLISPLLSLAFHGEGTGMTGGGAAHAETAPGGGGGVGIPERRRHQVAAGRGAAHAEMALGGEAS